MSKVHVTIEEIRKVNADIINKTPKPKLSRADTKLYDLVVSNGVLPDDVKLRKIFKKSKIEYGAS